MLFRSRRPGAARSVILFNLLGGPSQLDMFDMKPGAPLEIRGSFQPIQTSVPGVQICEYLPNTARIMHKLSLIRSVTHNYNAHNPLNIMTGFSLGNPAALVPDPADPPDIGAVCQYLGLGPGDMPGAVCLPCYPGWGESSMYPGIRRRHHLSRDQFWTVDGGRVPATSIDLGLRRECDLRPARKFSRGHLPSPDH